MPVWPNKKQTGKKRPTTMRAPTVGDRIGDAWSQIKENPVLKALLPQTEAEELFNIAQPLAYIVPRGKPQYMYHGSMEGLPDTFKSGRNRLDLFGRTFHGAHKPKLAERYATTTEPDISTYEGWRVAPDPPESRPMTTKIELPPGRYLDPEGSDYKHRAKIIAKLREFIQGNDSYSDWPTPPEDMLRELTPQHVRTMTPRDFRDTISNAEMYNPEYLKALGDYQGVRYKHGSDPDPNSADFLDDDEQWSFAIPYDKVKTAWGFKPNVVKTKPFLNLDRKF